MSDPDPHTSSHLGLPFLKMHGLGNDFVVIDSRISPRAMTPALARALGDRHRGVGFDQLAVIEPGNGTDLELTFWNADGSTAGACGNATRCIARREMELTGQSTVTLRTERGVLEAVDAGHGLTSVNMGQPMLDWEDIPLAHACDTLELPIDGAPVATGMGNPHCTFFVEDADAVDLATQGARFEHHPLFPDRTNVQFAHVIAPDHLRMRVWERGVGVTLASGSSSCAVAVAAARLGLTGRTVRLSLDGGEIAIDWRDDGVWMTGATAHVFSAELTPAFLDSLG
jgi:diaminopimelate epimerase